MKDFNSILKLLFILIKEIQFTEHIYPFLISYLYY